MVLDRTDRHDLDMTEALQRLRAVSKQYKVPVVVAAHLKRRQGLDITAEPTLTDFAFSSGLERMARVALGLYKINPKPGDAPQMGVAVLKQTNGPSGQAIALEIDESAAMVRNESSGAAAREMERQLAVVERRSLERGEE